MDTQTGDPILELAADVARKAIQDYRKGPDGNKHYQSALRFLTESGLINRLAGAPTMNTDEAQPKPNLVDQYLQRRDAAARGEKPPIEGNDPVSQYLRDRKPNVRAPYQPPMRPED